MGGQAFDKDTAKRDQHFIFDPFKLTIIGLDTKDGPEHPLYDERIHEPLTDEFLANIELLGIIQAIRVVKDPVSGAAEVVAGRKRVMAARILNERFKKAGSSERIGVPALIERDRDTLRSLAIVAAENEARTPDSLLTRAKKAARMQSFGMTQDDIAKAMACTKASVANLMLLRGLAPQVLKRVEEGALTPSAALGLKDLPHVDQVKAAHELIASGKATAVASKAKARAVRTGVEGIKKPGKRQIMRAIAYAKENEDADDELHPEFIRGLRVAIGDLDARSVLGLSAIMAGKAE